MTVKWWVAALAFLLLLAWVVILVGTDVVTKRFERDLREYRDVEQEVRDDDA